MPAVKKVVSVRNNEVQRVVVYNPLEEAVNQVMMVLVERADVCVMSGEWEPIGSQVSPEWSNDKSGRSMSSGKHRLHWLARIPPMGIQTFFISVSKDSMSCKAANQALVKFSNAPDAAFSCPPPYECVQIEEEVVKISNQYQVMTFSVQDGLLKHLQNERDGIEISLKEDIAFYSSFGSGAYLFKPVGEAKSIVDPGGSMVVTIGTLMQEVVTMPKTSWNPSPPHRTARLYTVSDSVQAFMAEMEYHVELLGYDYNDKELIVRFKTDLDTKNTFFSDLNGYQTIARHYQGKIPLQGNYYPMPSLAFLQGSEGRRFSLHSRQAVSVTSLGSGTIEVMLDRRLTRDDERGLGQGVLDNRPMDVMFHILLETNITSVPSIVASTPRVPSLLSHRVSAQLNYPTHSFFGRIENSSNVQRAPLQKKFAPLAADFPCDLHIVSFKAVEYSEKAEYALTLHRRGWDDSFCRRGRTDCIQMSDANMSTSDIFDHLTVSSVKTCSLNLLHDRAEDFSRLVVLGRKQRGGGSAVEKEFISLAPMEIQSLKLRLLWEHSQQRIGMV
jgi:alpha-mannosidase II